MCTISSYGKLLVTTKTTRITYSSSRLRTKDSASSPWTAQATVWCSTALCTHTENFLWDMLTSEFYIEMRYLEPLADWLEWEDSNKMMLIFSVPQTKSCKRCLAASTSLTLCMACSDLNANLNSPPDLKRDLETNLSGTKLKRHSQVLWNSSVETIGKSMLEMELSMDPRLISRSLML